MIQNILHENVMCFCVAIRYVTGKTHVVQSIFWNKITKMLRFFWMWNHEFHIIFIATLQFQRVHPIPSTQWSSPAYFVKHFHSFGSCFLFHIGHISWGIQRHCKRPMCHACFTYYSQLLCHKRGKIYWICVVKMNGRSKLMHNIVFFRRIIYYKRQTCNIFALFVDFFLFLSFSLLLSLSCWLDFFCCCCCCCSWLFWKRIIVSRVALMQNSGYIYARVYVCMLVFCNQCGPCAAALIKFILHSVQCWSWYVPYYRLTERTLVNK